MCELNVADFSMVWSYEHTKKQYWVSLRGSESCTVDLSVVAKKYNGGVLKLFTFNIDICIYF